MAAQTMSQRSGSHAWMVFVVTAIALLIGWGLKGFTEGQTREIAQGGVTATLPAGWVVENAQGGPLGGGQTSIGLVFTARDPLDPATRYLVTTLPASPETDLAAAAALRNLQRAQDNTAYRVLEQTPVTLKGRDGYRVTFAYVFAGRVDEVPVVYQGIDYYFVDGDATIIVTLETTQSLEDALGAFQDFAAEVGLGG